MTDGARPRVVLVDDHRMFRSGVRAELGEGVDIIGEAEDVDSAVATVLATSPDVVLLDVHLPGGNGREVLRRCDTDHTGYPQGTILAGVSDNRRNGLAQRQQPDRARSLPPKARHICLGGSKISILWARGSQPSMDI